MEAALNSGMIKDAVKMTFRKSKSLEYVKPWKRCRIGCYIVYGVCLAALGVSLAFFLFRGAFHATVFPGPEWQDASSHPIASAVLKWMDGVVHQDALTAIISTIGVSAIAIAWLIGVTGQTVCGERIGVLVKWAYPWFFYFYFVIFLLTLFVGIYTGKLGAQRFPTLTAAIGLITGAVFIGRVCYVFVINFKARERIAYTYYHQLFQYKPGKSMADDFKLQCERAILRITKHTAQLETSGEYIPDGTIFSLWSACIENYRKASAGTAEDSVAGHGLDMSCCAMGEQFWDSLIPAQRRIPLRQDFLLYLNRRDAGAEANGLSHLNCENHLIAGLLLKLAHAHKADDLIWKDACSLLFDLHLYLQEWGSAEPLPAAFHKLFWGLVWIMCVESAFNPSDVDGGNQKTEAEFEIVGELCRRAGITKKANTEDEKTDCIRDFLNAFSDIYCREHGYQNGTYGRGSFGRMSYDETIFNYLGIGLDDADFNARDSYAVARAKLGLGKELVMQ